MKKAIVAILTLAAVVTAMRVAKKNTQFIPASELDAGKLDVSDGIVTFNVDRLRIGDVDIKDVPSNNILSGQLFS